jgi:hypothetical protein
MTDVVTSPVRAVRWAPLGVLAGGLAGCAYLAFNDPSDPASVMPACPFHAVTGLWCPGCGGLRMVHALLHGRVGEAAQDNLLLLVASPVLLGLLLAWAVTTLRGGRYRLRMSVPVAAGLFALTLVWFVARNLPGFPLQPV